MSELNMGEATLKKICLFALLAATLLFPSEKFVQAQTPQETLKQYISDLLKNPNDNALREKIIMYVQTMSPAPIVPEETVKYEGRSEAAVRNAKTPQDYLEASREYSKALLLAPWVASYYFNLGVVLEKAGKPDEAIKNLRLYLLAAPNASDVREVQKRIAGLEYEMEKQTERNKAEQSEKIKMESLSGQWNTIKRWDGAKSEWISGKGPQYHSAKPTRIGPWMKNTNYSLYVDVVDDAITISIRTNPSGLGTPILASQVYRGTIRGNRIEGIMTEEWNHRMSCPKKVTYQFEGFVWAEDQVIMLIIEDCYFDGNPANGYGCRHQQNKCYNNSILLERAP